MASRHLIIFNENLFCSAEPLKRYRKKHITLTLPEGKTISNIKWFYVWCDEFAVSKCLRTSPL